MELSYLINITTKEKTIRFQKKIPFKFAIWGLKQKNNNCSLKRGQQFVAFVFLSMDYGAFGGFEFFCWCLNFSNVIYLKYIGGFARTCVQGTRQNGTQAVLSIIPHCIMQC